MNNKKVYAVLSAAAIGTIFSVAINTSVKADTRDFTNIKTQKVYKAADWRADDALFDELVDELTNNPDDYVVEFTGNQYVYDGLLNALINNVPFNDALQDPSLIYTPETPALEVSSVSASNLKAVKVTFNKEIDATTATTTNIKGYLNGSSVALATPVITVSEDKKSLTFEQTGAAIFAQSDSLKLTFANIKDAEGNVMPSAQQIVEVKDIVAPEAVSAELVNNKQLVVTFSEPMNMDTAGIYKTTDVTNSGAIVKVDGVLTFAKYTKDTAKNTVTIDLFNALSNGPHTISIAEAKDFANFKTAAKDFAVTAVADTVAPVAQSVQYVAKNQIKVIFDEAVSNATTAYGTPVFKVYEAGNATDLASGGGAAVSYTAAKPNEAIITLATPMTVASTVGLDVKYTNVQDQFGNKNTTEQTISTQIPDDTTKPVVSAYEVEDNNVIKVTFSKKVDAYGATAQFKLYKADGTTVVNASAASVTNYDTTDPDGKSFKVTFAGLTNVDAAEYKVKVTGTRDVSIRQNVIEDQILDLTAKDSKAPTLSSAVLVPDATGNNDKIELVFSEAMDTTTLSNIANYFVGSGSASIAANTISGATVDSVSADGKKVVLVIPDADNSDTSGGLTAAVDTIAMPALKDTTGNYMSNATIASPFTIASGYSAITSADIKVEATGKNTIVVTALNGYTFSTADANAFKFKDAANVDASTNNADLGIVAAQVSQDGKTITLTTSVALTADAKADSTDADTVPEALKLFIDGTGVKDQNGQSLAIAETAAVSPGHTNLADKIVASLDTVTVGTTPSDTDTVTLTFDEEVVKNPALVSNDLLASAFEVKDGTTTLIPVVDYTAEISGGNVVITVVKDGIVDKDLSVKLINTTYLADVNGNAVNVSDAKTAESVTELFAPTVVGSVEDSTTQVTITFSEAIDPTTVIPGNFTGTAVPSAVELLADGKTVVVTVGAMSGTETIIVGAGVTDLAGNAIVPVTLTNGSDF